MSQQGSKRYGLICESKTEGPIIFEGYPMTREEALSKMHEFARSNNIIRVAVFEMKYAGFGNYALIDSGDDK